MFANTQGSRLAGLLEEQTLRDRRSSTCGFSLLEMLLEMMMVDQTQ
jgi:hypothetical protein